MLRVEGVRVAYPPQVVIHDLDLTAADGEVVAVLGPSGCGKSTLLRAVAGLEPLLAGTVTLDGRRIDRLRPDQRDVGLMFQEHALFPHRDVADNVAFGPRMRGWPSGEVRTRVAEALDLMDLGSLGSRRVAELSGGERQRVALARAIAPRPRVLMLDEPLGSLDRALQRRLLDDLPQVFARLGTTVLYVTHDQHEALVLADRLAVMRAGRLVQVGSPDQLWREPRTAFVARFLGLEPVLDVELADGHATTPWGVMPVTTSHRGPAQAILLPEGVRLVDAEDDRARDHERLVAGTVIAHRFAGDHRRLTIRLASGPDLDVQVLRGHAPAAGQRATLALDPGALHVLEPEDHIAPTSSDHIAPTSSDHIAPTSGDQIAPTSGDDPLQRSLRGGAGGQ